MSIHNIYNTLKPHERNAVDDAFKAVAFEFRTRGLQASNMDDAERLVEALAIYCRASNPLPTPMPQPRTECGAERVTLHNGESRHVCVKARGHSGPHQCGGECRHQWEAACEHCLHPADVHDDTTGTLFGCLIDECDCVGYEARKSAGSL